MEVSKNGSVSGFKCKLHELNSLGWVKKSLEEVRNFQVSAACTLYKVQFSKYSNFEFLMGQLCELNNFESMKKRSFLQKEKFGDKIIWRRLIF